jgi:hypothetical protein
MNNGSILSGSSVSSTVEYRGTRARLSEESQKSSSVEHFDSLINLFEGKKEQRSLSSYSQAEDSQVADVGPDEEQSDEDLPTEDCIVTQSTPVESNTRQPDQDSKEIGKKTEEPQNLKKEDASKELKTKDSELEKNTPMLSSTISLKQQNIKGDTEKAEGKKATVEPGTTEPLKLSKQRQSISNPLASDKSGESVKVESGKTEEGKAAATKLVPDSVAHDSKGEQSISVSEKGAANSKPDGKITALNAKADTVKIDATKVENSVPEEGKKIHKTSGVGSAKTTYSLSRTPDAENIVDNNNQLKHMQVAEEDKLRVLDREIGIKGAVHAVDKQISMVAKEKTSEDNGTEKVYLRENVDAGSGNKAQTVAPRSDMGGFSNQSQSGNNSQSSEGREQFRQWITEGLEARSTGQAAQQSQFVDRTTVSQLSVHVLTQIMNHIERLREGDKNRVRVSLGTGDRGGISVDIKLEDGGISTSFEGDENILNELKKDWADISERASRKGVILNDPQFISYSSSVEGSTPLPDSDIEKEEKSQSVIQHKDNQPMRPVLQTTAAGSGGPVHLYA